MVDCPDNGPYVWERCRQIGCADLAPALSHFCAAHKSLIGLQRPEGCLDAFVEALLDDEYVRLLLRTGPVHPGPRSAQVLRESVQSALNEARVILTMRR